MTPSTGVEGRSGTGIASPSRLVKKTLLTPSQRSYVTPSLHLGRAESRPSRSDLRPFGRRGEGHRGPFKVQERTSVSGPLVTVLYLRRSCPPSRKGVKGTGVVCGTREAGDQEPVTPVDLRRSRTPPPASGPPDKGPHPEPRCPRAGARTVTLESHSREAHTPSSAPGTDSRPGAQVHPGSVVRAHTVYVTPGEDSARDLRHSRPAWKLP